MRLGLNWNWFSSLIALEGCLNSEDVTIVGVLIQGFPFRVRISLKSKLEPGNVTRILKAEGVDRVQNPIQDRSSGHDLE
jgi:hypothetical protein